MSRKRKKLQVEINPHFFYNTLNGMIALNRMGEKKKLQKTIMNLAELCRYASMGEEDTATIEEECTIQGQYLELEKLKYDNRIEYEIHVEDSCADCEIPKMLLQPIIENSLSHGMGECGQSLMVKIDVSSAEVEGKGKMIKILIRDNGVGFDAESVSEETEDSGIAYVKKRAKQFDNGMMFECKSKPGEGTETIIMIRKERKESDYFSCG